MIEKVRKTIRLIILTPIIIILFTIGWPLVFALWVFREDDVVMSGVIGMFFVFVWICVLATVV
jgi:hypothetical protein